MERWRPGDRVVLRNVWHGRVFSALATTAVEAAGDRVVLWVGPGSERKLPPGRHQPWNRDWTPVDRPWHGRGVFVAKELGAAHSIWHFCNAAGEFSGWYGNLEDPWRPTRFGYDSRDHILDVWRPRDGDWRWKDEDEFDEAIGHGLFDAAEAGAIRAEGDRVMRETKLPTGWEDRTPPLGWQPPQLPNDWHVV